MNGSYGYDGMNTERFVKIKFCDESQTRTSIISTCSRAEYKISDDIWFVEIQPKYFHCSTPIQESVFTLDNAKFWYLTFIHKFLLKCLDLERFHFTSGDTDSVYMAVSGDPTKPSSQVSLRLYQTKYFTISGRTHSCPTLRSTRSRT